MLPISKPYMPPMDELAPFLSRIWETGIVTNNGPLVRQFEDEIKKYTGVKHVFFVTNGTIALQLALRALNIKGKILTTPFSMLATLSSVLWEQYEPCFADIDPHTLNLSPDEVEKKMDNNIACILATHVYGNSCDIDRMKAIADNRNIPLVFDASHAFGSKYQDRDIMTYGTISTLSLQAFKILHSVEGGLIFTNDDHIAESLLQMRYFGYDTDMNIRNIGINGKSSEINAAIGLCVLNHFPEVKLSRKTQSEYYDLQISKNGIPVSKPQITGQSEFNYAYYPIIFSSETEVLKVEQQFRKNDIQFKRYFYPSLNTVPQLRSYESMPISESISSRVICLPLHYQLTTNQQDLVIRSVKEALEN